MIHSLPQTKGFACAGPSIQENHKEVILKLIRTLRRFFAPEAALEIWAFFKPKLLTVHPDFQEACHCSLCVFVFIRALQDKYLHMAFPLLMWRALLCQTSIIPDCAYNVDGGMLKCLFKALVLLLQGPELLLTTDNACLTVSAVCGLASG
jgi:hypothetical protein